MSVVVGIAALRGNTEAFSRSTLGELSLLTLCLALASNTFFVPPLQVALRNHLVRGEIERSPLFAFKESRLFASVVCWCVGATLLGGALASYWLSGAWVLGAACAAWLYGSANWSLLKTDLNLSDRNDAYAFATLAAGVGPQFFAGAICLALHGGLHLAIAVQATWLVLSAQICAAHWRVPIPGSRQWRMLPRHAPTSDGHFVRSSAQLVPFGAAQWAFQSAPRWILALQRDVASVGQFSALWSPINQAFQVSANTLVLSERPRFYRALGRPSDVRNAMLTWLVLQTAVNLLLAAMLVLLNPLWQRIALSAAFRGPTSLVALIVVGQLVWSLALVAEHALLVWDRQSLSSMFAIVSAAFGCAIFLYFNGADNLTRAAEASIATSAAYLVLGLSAVAVIHTRRNAGGH